MKIAINDQEFILHYTGAIFWINKNILLISDVHLGKVSHFRKNGIAVPKKASLKNFELLDTAVAFFDVKQIIFLGDLFHSAMNNEWELFLNWTNKISLEIILITGNHDIIAKEHYNAIAVKVMPEMAIDNFLLTHYPEERSSFFNFCGHIHPAIKIYGTGRQTLNVKCFFHKEKQLILPSFGEFTGSSIIFPSENDSIYVIAKKEVLLIAKI